MSEKPCTRHLQKAVKALVSAEVAYSWRGVLTAEDRAAATAALAAAKKAYVQELRFIRIPVSNKVFEKSLPGYRV